MAFRENSINDFFNSKTFTALMAIAVIASACINDPIWESRHTILGNHGILFPSLAGSITNATASIVANVACTLIIGILMVILNKTFNFIRSVTWIFSSVFLLLMAGNPISSGLLYSGTTMALCVAIITFILFASFQNRRAQRGVFTTFALVTLMAMFQYTYMYLFIALILGYMLMQIMNLRSILAIIIGIITPFWIVLGCHFADFSDFSLPSYQSLWTVMQRPQMHLSFISIIALSVFTIVLTCANLFQIINYKLQVRAYNGFFVYLTALTTTMLALDYRNSFIYLPVLYLCFSIQFAHFFTINNHTRRYIAPIALIVAVIAVRLTHYFL